MSAVLDPTFVFSQYSLGDYVDCPRRFYLKYVAQQPWPSIEATPREADVMAYRAYLRRGAVLHRWIERYWLRLPTPDVANIADDELRTWWLRFQQADFQDLPPVRLPEFELVAALDAYRLYARFDLLALSEPSDANPRAVIVDWKTLRGAAPPSLEFLRQRIQTRVYLYTLVTASAPLNNGRALEPERCAMRYWLANFPEQPWVEIPYSQTEYERDAEYLRALVARILKGQHERDFPMTDDERQCTYCVYRTLCARKGAPDAPLPDEDWLMPSLDSVPDVEY